MVLAVDIGNSNICIGGLTGAEHCSIQITMRMVKRPRCTADAYAAEMKFLLRRLLPENLLLRSHRPGSVSCWNNLLSLPFYL